MSKQVISARHLLSLTRTSSLSFSKFLFFLCAMAALSLTSVLTLDFMRHYAKRSAGRFEYDYNEENEASNEIETRPISSSPPAGYELNNWGSNDHKLVKEDRQRDVPDSELKTILMWNDAYGVREYDIGHGREPFYKFRCEETRCLATSNRSLLPSVDQFDALLIHQRGIDWDDMPERRSPKQRYVQWVMESQQYLYMDINKLNGMFNWTMTFKRNSDFYLPYGRFFKVKDHPEGEELEQYIRAFGKKNAHLAGNRTKFQAAWFVSHCATQSRRERYAKSLGRHMDVHIYGKCGKFSCSRDNETACYLDMERDYRFYLSFENSICDDYVTEKFFNVLKYDVVPVTYGGADLDALAPPHSAVNVMKFGSPEKLVAHLKLLQEDDAKFAEYFWWRDFYEVRNTAEDRAQPYCDLCKRLNDPEEPPKVYENMYKWWVTDSHCKRLRSSKLG